MDTLDTLKTLLDARYYLNMRRIGGLLRLVSLGKDSSKASGAALESEGVRGDVCRAIVVFLHATFEDVLRTAARERLNDANVEVLNKIPLVGMAGRMEKFGLGALAAHRGKTVDQIIRESAEDYLGARSFGSCRDVEIVLGQMGLDTKPFKFLYADLDQMINRRHRIVHEADLEDSKSGDAPCWTIGDDFLLAIWFVTLMAFHAMLCVSVDPANALRRWYSAKYTKAIEAFRQVRIDIIALGNQPKESMVSNIQKALQKLGEVMGYLAPPSDEELLAIWVKMKSPDDSETEDQVRAKIAAWRLEQQQQPPLLASGLDAGR